MDPLTAIGLLSSVGQLVEGIAATTDRIVEWKTRWAVADLSVNLLVGQLCTVKTALSKLERLSSTHLGGGRFASMSDDVELTVRGCHDLLNILNQHLARMDEDARGHVTTKSKARMLWDKVETDLYQTFLDRQINALNLYLTVAQQEALERPVVPEEDAQSVIVLQSARAATESLYALKGTPQQSIRNSFVGDTISDASSNISRQFDFDSEVLNSSPYRRATNNILRTLISAKKGRSTAKDPSILDQPGKSSSRSPLTFIQGVRRPPAVRTSWGQKPSDATTSPSTTSTESRSQSSVDSPRSSPPSSFRRDSDTNLRHLSVYGLARHISQTFQFCASLPSSSTASSAVMASTFMRHYLVIIVSSFRLIKDYWNPNVMAVAAQIKLKLFAADMIDYQDRREILDQFESLWQNDRYRALVLGSSNENVKAALRHLINSKSRMQYKSFSPSVADFEHIQSLNVRDIFSFEEKNAAKYQVTLSIFKDALDLAEIDAIPPRAHVTALVYDTEAIRKFFAKQQSSLHWGSERDMINYVDHLRGQVSRLITMADQTKLLRHVLQSRKGRNTIVIFSGYRQLQKVLSSKFGIVLSGAGQGAFPDIVKEMSDFLVDELRRQTSGNFEVFEAELSKVDSSLGKKIRKSVQTISAGDFDCADGIVPGELEHPEGSEKPKQTRTTTLTYREPPRSAYTDDGSPASMPAISRMNTDRTLVESTSVSPVRSKSVETPAENPNPIIEAT